MLAESVLDKGRLPNGIYPYPHQISAANQILHAKSLLLAYDVGVGKTFTASMAAMAYQQLTGGKIVVVAPASLQVNWQRETKGLFDINLFSSGKIPLPDDFGSDAFYLILDEAHQFQNTSSKRTQAITALSKAAQGVLPMTATPIRNYPSNLFPLLKIIGHPLGNVFERFKERYCDGKQSGSSNLMELHRKIQTQLIVGSKDDHLDLPPFKRVLKQIEFHGIGKILFDEVMNEKRQEYKERTESGEISKKGWAIVLINHLRMATAYGKSIAAVALAKKALDNDHQVVIFTAFNVSAEYIERRIDLYKDYEAHLLNGIVPKKKRQDLVDDFQEGEAQAFVMTRAGSAGLNLQKGTIFISVDRTWSPYDMIQAEGRIHRNGQERPCCSIWLQDEIIDPYIDAMMLRKYKVAREVLYGKRDTMEGLGNPGTWAKDLSSILFEYKEN